MLDVGNLSRRLTVAAARLDRRDFIILTMVLVPAGLLAAFLALASEVLEGETNGFDKAILIGLRKPGDLADPIGPHWLGLAMRDVTALGGFTVVSLVTVAAIGFLVVSRRLGSAGLLAASVIGGTVLSNLLKMVFARPRPDLVAHAVEVSSLSFPSGHAMLSAITYLTLGALLARSEERPARRAYILGVAVLLTLAIGVSRIYLGVHYPTDVLAGWAVGAAWAMICLGLAHVAGGRGDSRSDATE